MRHGRSIFRQSRLGFVTCLAILSLAGCNGNKGMKAEMKRDYMIVDRLEHADRYCEMYPAFAKAFAFLNQENLAQLSPGRHEIDGDRLFCSISKGPGRSRSEANLEAHRKYIDIQYVIAGTEEYGWKPTADCRIVHTAYDAEKDIGFFKDVPDSWNDVPAGSFVIFFPQDAHAPLVGAGEIHKAVLKIAVE